MTAEEFRQSNISSKIQKQIIIYDHLIEGFEAIKPHLLVYDGKVINKRLLKEIEPDMPHKLIVTINTSVIKIEDWKHKQYKRTEGHGQISDNFRNAVIVYQGNNRLDANSTCNIINCRIKDLRENIEACKKDLNSFQDELDDWNKIEALVKEYDKKYSHNLKGYIDMHR